MKLWNKLAPASYSRGLAFRIYGQADISNQLLCSRENNAAIHSMVFHCQVPYELPGNKYKNLDYMGVDYGKYLLEPSL